MQRLMLLHARTAQSNHDVLFNQIVYKIEGDLDANAYQRAWQLMVERHPALRTIFVWQDGKDPLQVVREQVTLPWIEHDWRQIAAAEQDQKLEKLLADDRSKGFDLLQAPLMRLYLLRIAEFDYRLVWSTHHLIIDRWCIGIIFTELKDAYEAYAKGALPTLAPAPRYRDYIAWLAKQDVQKAETYWRKTLRGTHARPIALQTESNDETADLEVIRISLKGNEWASLRQFALSNNVTPSTLVAAAWAVVLGAATGTDDTLFGLTVSGRPADLPQVGQTVGCFINNVPLRVLLLGEQPLVAWLQAVQEQQLGLQAYEYASLAQIQAWSDLKKKGPLFDTLLVMQAPVQKPEPIGLTVQNMRGGMQTGYALSLGAVPEIESLRLSLTYDPRLVPQALVGQITLALPRVLLSMPDEQVSLLSDLLAQVNIENDSEQTVEIWQQEWPSEQPFVPSRTVTEQALAQIWAEVLGLARVGIEDRFYELGGDSIKALQLLTLIEERLGQDMPISLLFGDPTVKQMAKALGDDATDLPEDPVLVPLNQQGTKPPIFFTHGVYGGLMWLTNLLPLLEPDQPAYGLQAVGLQLDAEPDYSIKAMSARYVQAIQRVQPSGPYHIAGFCFGGLLAYEIARQLEQRGQDTALLAIIDGFPPRVFHRRRPLYDPLRLQIIRQSAPYWVQGYQAFGGLRLKERVLSKFGLESSLPQDGTSDKNQEIQQQITAINQRAGDEYEPQEYGGQITLIRAKLLGVRHALFGPVDPQRGWGSLAMGGVSVRSIDGTHVGILTNPYVSELAQELNDALQTTMVINHSR